MGTASCSVTYAITGQWQGGFQGDVTVRNTGSGTVDGWTLRWAFADGQQITQGWGGTFSQTGSAVTVTNAAYNATIAAGGTASFGFLGTLPATANNKPTAFTLNGAACTTA